MDSTRTGDLSKVDHVILGIDDLQKGIEELERRTGVRAAFGGAHPGRGTLRAAGVGVEVREGGKLRIHLSLDCPKGRVDF
jgi:hypothetical protein